MSGICNFQFRFFWLCIRNPYSAGEISKTIQRLNLFKCVDADEISFLKLRSIFVPLLLFYLMLQTLLELLRYSLPRGQRHLLI
jgi:hypothetical protein